LHQTIEDGVLKVEKVEQAAAQPIVEVARELVLGARGTGEFAVDSTDCETEAEMKNKLISR